MGKSEEADLLSVHVSKQVIRMIEARADALSWSKSKFTATLLENWLASGAAAIDENDRIMLPLVLKKLAAEANIYPSKIGRMKAAEARLKRIGYDDDIRRMGGILEKGMPVSKPGKKAG